MKFIAVKQKLKQEIKELQEKLNSANRVIYGQMQEIQELNNVCEYNDKAHRRELERKDAGFSADEILEMKKADLI